MSTEVWTEGRTFSKNKHFRNASQALEFNVLLRFVETNSHFIIASF